MSKGKDGDAVTVDLEDMDGGKDWRQELRQMSKKPENEDTVRERFDCKWCGAVLLTATGRAPFCGWQVNMGEEDGRWVCPACQQERNLKALTVLLGLKLRLVEWQSGAQDSSNLEFIGEHAEQLKEKLNEGRRGALKEVLRVLEDAIDTLLSHEY